MPDNQNILTVSELSEKIKNLLEGNFRFVKLMAEVSNFKHHQSGHWYFTLKDENAQMSAVIWRSRTLLMPIKPENGMQAVVKGKITVYPGTGTYRLEVWELTPQGAGELQLRFEKLKQKLFEEGIFDEAHKLQLSKFPENAVLITSRSGAVLQDFINIIKRRYPLLNVYIFPVNVQGYTASSEIIHAIRCVRDLYDKGELQTDLIVVARGGGSIEDLWQFNDEKLARTIYDCNIPIVSAVGHEVDFTICDFAADLRAPTPSAAAELITPDINDLIETIGKFNYFYRTQVNNRLATLKNRLKEIRTNYYLNRPGDVIADYYRQISDLNKNISSLAVNRINSFSNRLKSCRQTLFHVNPEINLKKGYAVIFKENNELFFNEDKPVLEFEIKNLVTAASQLKPGEEVNIKFHDKQKLAKVIK